MAINLTPEQIHELDSYRVQLGTIAEQIEKAERAGIDVADLKDQFVRIENLRAGLLREYGPPGPKRRRGASGTAA